MIIPDTEITSEYDVKSSLWIVSTPIVNMYGFHECLKDAVEDLKESIGEYFNSIKDGENLGPIPTRDLEILKEWAN